MVYVNPAFRFPTSKDTEKLFDDYLIGDLSSGSEVQFGQISLGHKAQTCTEDLALCGGEYDLLSNHERVILVYHLRYEDSLSPSKPPYNHFPFFIYQIGSQEVSSIIGDDFVKVREKLLKSFSHENNNPDLIKYINNIKSNSI